MKRTSLKATLALLVVATATSCYNLAPENMGALTSADIYRGEGNVLKIDSLVEYINSLVKEKETLLGVHPSTSQNFVTTTYSYGGKHTKEVTISCNLTQIPDRPMELTGYTKKDSTNLFWTHYYREQGLLYQQVYDVISNTCKLLADNVKEQNKSLWERHNEGADSVFYSLALREYPQGDTLRRWNSRHGSEYSCAPELVSFSYRSTPDLDAPSLAGGQALGRHKGFGSFTYTYTPDSVYDNTHELLDKKQFGKLVKSALKQKGIESRPFYLSHDKDCPKVSMWAFSQETTPMEMIYMKEVQPYSESLGRHIEPAFSETKGTIYTIKSKEQMDAVLHQLEQCIWQYLDRHPHLNYRFTPDTPITGDMYYTKMDTYFTADQRTPVYEESSIILHRTRDEFHILVLDTTGDFWLPAEWPVVKSWKNGKVTYARKPKLTKKELRNYISGTMHHQGSYTAWEDSSIIKKDKK